MTPHTTNLLVVFFLYAGIAGPLHAAQPAPTPPDLTMGGKRDDSHDWQLGPTGARGWIHTAMGHSAAARQILVTVVDPGSPADGILSVHDVIVGVNDKPFADDARRSFGNAISAAEAKDGVLRLLRWREGQSVRVELKLAVLGAYSATAPYDCPKSKRIFEQGCRLIASRNWNEGNAIPNDLNALALLASGKKEYLPLVAAYAKKAAAALRPGTWTWYYGYGNIFLAEYVLATGDKTILDELKRTVQEAIVGQSGVGTWGHEYETTASGNLNGYGCMILPGLLQTTGLVLARQAGVKGSAIDKAIDKSAKFLRYYANKGALPYGDHQPWPDHEDNGKCSLAAVLFDLLDDTDASSFFARMSTAAYDERERGHTGNFFNVQWALPGVSRCGPLATGAYLKEQAWYYDLARNWKGGYGYQGSPVGAEEHQKYTDWDCTGAYLLAYALPLKSLHLTGKKPCLAKPLNAKDVEGLIADGREFFSLTGRHGATYDGRTTEQLLAGLSSWSPAVRKRSAQTLGKREGDFAPGLLKRLAGPDRYARYGACEALGFLGSRGDVAAPQLRALLNDKDSWMQSLACNSLARLGPETRKASLNDLLALLARKNPDDPRGMIHRAASIALFSPYPGNNTPTILNYSLEGVDRKLLYPAMVSLLQNDDGAVRLGLERYYSKLTEQDLAVMLPDIIKAIETMAPSDEMFADSIRLAGLDLLSRLRISEGMALCVSSMEKRWGNNFKKRLEYLKRYGACAKEVLPQLRDKMKNRSPSDTKAFETCITDIEASQETPTLITLKDFIAKASAGGNASHTRK